MRSMASVTISSSLKQGPGERHCVPTASHPTEQQHPNIPRAGKQPPCRRSGHWFLVHAGSSPHPQHPQHCPALCWSVWIWGLSGSTAQLSAGRGRELFRAGRVPLPPMKAGTYLGGEVWSCRVSRASRSREASQAVPWATSATGTCQGSRSHRETARLGGNVSGPWRRPALSKLSSPKLLSPHVPQPGLSSTQGNVSCLPTLLPQHRGCGLSYLAL